MKMNHEGGYEILNALPDNKKKSKPPKKAVKEQPKPQEVKEDTWLSIHNDALFHPVSTFGGLWQ